MKRHEQLKDWISSRSKNEAKRIEGMYSRQTYNDSHQLSIEISRKAKLAAQTEYNARKQSAIQLEINKGLTKD